MLSFLGNMKIIEQFVCGKHTAEDCEDGIVVTRGFAAVIDGSTSKTQHRLDSCMKNGRFAMLLVAEYISNMREDISVDEFCRGVTERVALEYKTRNMEPCMALHPEERLTASAVVFSLSRKEVWMVGDCQAIVDGRLYENPKPYEHEIAMQRVNLIRQGASPEEARRTIVPRLVEAMLKGQNQEYAVIDGTPVFKLGVKVIPVVHDVVLASDGYPFLLPSLKESEAALREHIRKDPQNIGNFVATKGIADGNCSFDDRAYIKLTV